MKTQRQNTIAIIGAGEVGSTFAYAALVSGVARKLILINRTREKARAEVMDLNHAVPFCDPTQVEYGDYTACAEADLIVITAGASQEPGMSRLDLTQKNADITRDVVKRIMKHNPNPILLIVTNPVDVLTYVALKESGLPPSRVLGSGTVLDSARFCSMLSRQCGVDPRNVLSHVVGEHGDSEVLLWSRVRIGGVALDEYCNACDRKCSESFRQEVDESVRKAAYKIIDAKGATSYGIGMTLVRIAGAILHNQSSVLTVSSLVSEFGDVRDFCFSQPRVINRNGVVNTLNLSPTPQEEKGLIESASILRENLESIGY